MLLGMDGHEISRQEIINALNTEELQIYNEEVTFLRNQKILEEIKTNPQALRYSKLHKIPKNQVGRFKVKLPQS